MQSEIINHHFRNMLYFKIPIACLSHLASARKWQAANKNVRGHLTFLFPSIIKRLNGNILDFKERTGQQTKHITQANNAITNFNSKETEQNLHLPQHSAELACCPHCCHISCSVLTILGLKKGMQCSVTLQ